METAIEKNQREQEQKEQANAADKAPPIKKSILLPTPYSSEEDKQHMIGCVDNLPPAILDIIAANYHEEKIILYRPPQASFFSKTIAVMLHQAANDILDGSEAAVHRVIALVKENPLILNYPTEGCDRLGRRVQGTLLQIAAMAGDVNIRELSVEEKDHRGIVELLAEAGNLSPEDTAKQIKPVLFSDEAIQASANRNERILAAVKQLTESIAQAEIDQPAQWSLEALKSAQEKCKPAIDAFRTTLQATFDEVVTTGYLFETNILHEAMLWFQKNERLAESPGWKLKNDLLWVNGMGSLQWIATARDLQVYSAGIHQVVQMRHLPLRSLKNLQSSEFPQLGLACFLGYYGNPRRLVAVTHLIQRDTRILSQEKTKALRNLLGAQVKKLANHR